MEEQTIKKENLSTHKSQNWLLVTSFLQVVLLVYIAMQIGGIGGTIQGAAVAGAPTVERGVADPEPQPVANVDMKQLVDDDPSLGEKDAPITIVEFSDYECPFCARFYSQTLPQIKSNYIETGKVKLIYRDFPLSFHQQAEPAAIAANCAGQQGKYFEYHDKIFDDGGAAGKSSADYKKWAQELKLNVAQWEKCLSDPAQKQEIQKDFLDGQRAGVQGTPGFFVNGKVVSGAQPFSVFQQIIEQELSS